MAKHSFEKQEPPLYGPPSWCPDWLMAVIVVVMFAFITGIITVIGGMHAAAYLSVYGM